jgi:hypothetical protein
MKIRVIQNNPHGNLVLSEPYWGKWWACRKTGEVILIDMEVDRDEDGNAIYGPTPSPVSEYISPNGWQPHAHYFDTSDECVAALAKVGMMDVQVLPWIARPTPDWKK